MGRYELAMTLKNTAWINPFRWLSWKPLGFVQLFLFIVLFLVFTPFLGRSVLLTALIAAFFLNVLAVTLSSAGFRLRSRWFLLALWFLVLLLEGAALRTKNIHADQVLLIGSDLVGALLTVSCAVIIMRYILTSHEVTVETIFAAFVAYFLIAFTFSSLYQAMAVFNPASFSMPAAGEHDDFLKARFHYFSFVTIASLGYGDIVPRLPVSRTLAILEAVTGQFYMAVVIAWLVSVYASNGKGSISDSRLTMNRFRLGERGGRKEDLS